MNAGSQRRDTNHCDPLFICDATEMLIGRGEDNDSISSADQSVTQIFARRSRPGAKRRVFVIDEQVGHGAFGVQRSAFSVQRLAFGGVVRTSVTLSVDDIGNNVAFFVHNYSSLGI
jgi:hypothetical protein